MYPVARGVKNNRLNLRCELRLLVHDISGPEGQPWTDLLGNPLKLVWSISKEDKILCRGEVTKDGWVIAKVRAQSEVGDLVLRVGSPKGPNSGTPAPTEEPLAPPEAEFDWCETCDLLPETNLHPVEDPRGAQARLNHLGYFAGRVDGEVGPVTKGAIVHFQSDYGLPTADELDPDTCRKIEEEFARLHEGS